METDSETSTFNAINPATGEAVSLALQELWLTGRVLPVGAALQVRHIFKCAEKKPVEVVYSFGLPRDAALRRFHIVGKGFSVASDLKPTEEAAKDYEAGIQAGRLSTLARQYRDGVVNLNVGNVRPDEVVAVYLEILAGVDRRDDSLRLRFPFTLSPTYHAKARAIEAAPGVGEMELPEEFGDVILPPWMKDGKDLHAVGFDLAIALPRPPAEIGSPSHSIAVTNGTDGVSHVRLAPAKDIPDRDLVLDVRTAGNLSGLTGGVGKDGKGHFAVVVPSTDFGKAQTGPCRIVFVVDRSGSMRGPAMAQAKQAVNACLGALSPEESFGIVAFDDHVEHMADHLLKGDAAGRDAAKRFLESVDARGGTELAAGFGAGASLLGKDGGDMLVLTDGQVSGTDEILAKARAAGIRIHCLGIGGASQDRFLTLLSRETGGVSRFLTPRERVDMAAVELFSSIGKPVATGLRVEVDASSGIRIDPEPPSTVFAGSPVVLFAEARGRKPATIGLTWEADGGRKRLEVPCKLQAGGDAEAVLLLQGARLITDMEARMVTSDVDRAVAKREAARQRKALEELSARYGLASQAMSLVAVVKRKGDKAGEVPKTLVVPVGMPQDTAFGAYFDSAIASAAHNVDYCLAEPESAPPVSGHARRASPLSSGTGVHFAAGEGPEPKLMRKIPEPKFMRKKEDDSYDLLLQLAVRIEPDGGMPGRSVEDRWFATAVALIFFAAHGHTARSGIFRMHAQRLLAFLKAAPSTAADIERQSIVELAESGFASSGDWTRLARRLLSKGRVSDRDFWLQARRF